MRASSHVVTQTPSIVSLRIKLSTAQALPCSHHSTVNEHVKFILFDDSQRQQFPFARRKKGGGERQCQVRFSIRNKCTKTTSNITTCSTAHFGVVFFGERASRAGGDSNKRTEVQNDKRHFHPKYVVHIKRHEAEQMRNLCFPSLFIGLLCVRTFCGAEQQNLISPTFICSSCCSCGALEMSRKYSPAKNFPRRRHEKILKSHDRQLFLSCFRSFSGFSLSRQYDEGAFYSLHQPEQRHLIQLEQLFRFNFHSLGASLKLFHFFLLLSRSFRQANLIIN